MIDPVEWARQVAAATKRFVAEAINPLLERIGALEAAKPQDGINGKDGRDGVDGRDGADGASVTIDMVLPTLQDQVKAFLDAVPQPEAGQRGADGRDGVDGKSVSIEEVVAALEPRVDAFLKSIPVPEAGVDGRDGRDGVDGRDGADGKSVTLDDVRGMLEAAVATWALDFERRAQDLLQRQFDRIPAGKDGRDGTDGLGFDDLDIQHDGEGHVKLVFTRGEKVKTFDLRLPVFIDRGVFKEGELYRSGHGVTFGGSLWIAQKDVPDGKPGLSPDWRLAVKKGRDGRDGRNGEKGEAGKNGRDGKDAEKW